MVFQCGICFHGSDYSEFSLSQISLGHHPQKLPMSLARFYCPDSHSDESFSLGDEEAAHAFKVLRMKPGDPLIAFDGKGWEIHGVVVEASKREVACRIVRKQWNPNELPGLAQVGIAMPKGDRQKLVIEKLVEMGIHQLVPLVSDRSVAEPSSGMTNRLHRYTIEASKQCGRNKLMEIHEPMSLKDYLQMSNSQGLDSQVLAQRSVRVAKWMAHPYTNPLEPSTPWGARSIEEVRVAIGPEGGFTDQEVEMGLGFQWELLELGPRILRVETAVSYVASIFNVLMQPPRWWRAPQSP